MKTPSHFVSKFAVAVAVLLGSTAASAQSTIDNWVSPYGEAWMNGTQEFCWRSAFWTPATAIEGCDGAPAPAPAPAPVVQAPRPATPAVTPPAPAAPVATRVVFNADTFFDFDRATLKSEGRQLLDQVVSQIANMDLETVIAVGHTDWTGTEEYNQGLSERRAASVKNYLVERGVDANRIYTEGKGELSPVATNNTREGRAQNRRVEIEVVGNRRN